MKRSALLIAGSGQRGSAGYLPGTVKDVERFADFLVSSLGGAWEETEIKILQNPSGKDVIAAQRELKQSDFGFVLFTGHGCHKSSYTYVELAPNVEMDSADLLIGAPKQVSIFDCCRKVVVEPIMETVLAKADSAGVKTPTLHRSDCREYYDRRIAECGNTIVPMFSCSKDELASETPEGGYYAVALIDSARDWFNASHVDTNTKFEILPITKAHEDAATIVRKASGRRQNPDIGYPRSEPHFPFAIIT